MNKLKVERLGSSLVSLIFFHATVYRFVVTSGFVQPKILSHHSCRLASFSKHTDLIRDNNGSSEIGLVESSSGKFDLHDYNLVSPREWLEFKEATDGAPGAYTVIRCDFRPRSRDWDIWGEEFHTARLQESITYLDAHSKDHDLKAAAAESNRLMAMLLDSAKDQWLETILKDNEVSPESSIITLMLTILWRPIEMSSQVQVDVHGYSTEILTEAHSYSPIPVNANIAESSSHEAGKKSLPSRYDNFPQAKLSSWCNRRRILETTFKRDPSDEVILAESIYRHLYLLEGLTSNLFVLYPGGVVRTVDTDSALGGYSRQLIIDAAEECGLQVDVGPIPVDESSLWEEVFLTSSIKIVTPVAQINRPVVESGSSTTSRPISFEEIWVPSISSREEPAWKILYEKILSSRNAAEVTG
jgi:hypothetical protein